MAHAIIMRQYLRNVIGLSTDDQANMIISKGIGTLEDFAQFQLADIKTLCSSIIKPRGTIEVPDPANANRNRCIPNLGHNIPDLCETSMVLTDYGAEIYKMDGCPINPNSLLTNRLKQLKHHRTTIKNHNNPDSLPEVRKSFGIMKAIDMFPTFLSEKLGVNNMALSYVIREHAVSGVPSFLVSNRPYGTGYTQFLGEFIAHALHDGPEFAEYNATVLRLLQYILADTPHMSSMKPLQRSIYGRGAFQAIQRHNMGKSKWDKVLEDAESMVQTRVWNGKNSRFPFKAHINNHRESHNDFFRSSQHVDYDPPNEHTGVSILFKKYHCF